MVRLTRIYTKGGDKGTTSLGTGKRVPKHDQRVAAFGTVDEANAAIGIARLHTKGDDDAMLARIQNDLFDLAADLCSPDKGKGPGGERLAVKPSQVKRLEEEIDTLNAELAPLRTFVLAGGTPAAAYLHLARTICRRAERIVVRLADSGEDVSAEVKSYINRLSDFLFVASRYVNDKGARDVLWVPGANR
jgi:cob(I)alamin adenosyltransferase